MRFGSTAAAGRGRAICGGDFFLVICFLLVDALGAIRERGVAVRTLRP